MKHIAIFFGIIVVVVVFCLGGHRFLPKYKPPVAPDPFLEFESLEDACSYAEFDITVPENFSDAEEKVFRVLKAKTKNRRLIEIIFLTGGQVEVVRFRKSFGNADISGDRNRYPIVEDADAGNFLLKIKGTSDGFYNATWAIKIYSDESENQFAYSITTVQPLSRTDMIALAKEIL